MTAPEEEVLLCVEHLIKGDLLRDQSQPFAHGGRIGLAQIDAVEADSAFLRIVEAQQQLE